MSKESENMLTAVAVPGEDTPGLEEPIIVSAEQDPFALRIRDALLSDPRLGGADLEVRMSGECAVVSGTTQTEDQKNATLSITGRFVGRDRVIDEIETGEQISYEVCEA